MHVLNAQCEQKIVMQDKLLTTETNEGFECLVLFFVVLWVKWMATELDHFINLVYFLNWILIFIIILQKYIPMNDLLVFLQYESIISK